MMKVDNPRSGMARLAAVALLALFVLAPPMTAQAGKSHLLQKPEQHIMLQYQNIPGLSECFTTDRGFSQVSPDGAIVTEQFVIPEGYALVVTDVDWGVSGTMQQGRLAVFSISLQPGLNRVFRTSVLIDADRASGGYWRDSAAMTTGFVVKPGTPICPFAQTEYTFGGSNLNVQATMLRGYLIKSK